MPLNSPTALDSRSGTVRESHDCENYYIDFIFDARDLVWQEEDAATIEEEQKRQFLAALEPPTKSAKKQKFAK